MVNENYIKHLVPIILQARVFEDIPLDGDETENLVKYLQILIDFHEGNLTHSEYTDLINNFSPMR